MGKKYIFFSLILSIVIIIGSIFVKNYLENNKFKEIIKTSTQNTKMIDKNLDHNQALDFSDYIKSKNLQLPKVIINFDTHSDLYINKPITIPKEEGIASWLNAYLAKYPEVEELYWIMPDEEALIINLQKIFAQNDIKEIDNGIEFYGNSLNIDLPENYFIKNPLTEKFYTQNFYIDERNGQLNEDIRNNKFSQKLHRKNVPYKKVKIVTCTINTLPNLKGKKVFLSIDADYLSNSGFDTLEGFTLISTNKEIEEKFYNIFKTIQEKNIQPEYISMSLSPQYLPKNQHSFVNKIFDKIIKYSDKDDTLQNYTRGYNISPIGRNSYEKIDYTQQRQ